MSGRTREFGIRLAVGSQPQSILAGVLRDGASIAAIGVVIGGFGGVAIATLAASYVEEAQLPGALPIIGSLLLAAIVASLVPAARAARVDVMRALRSE